MSLAFDRYGTSSVGVIAPLPVLALHGFLGSARNLASLARAWAASAPGLSIVAADLLGHGRSPPLPADATPSVVAEAALALGARVFDGRPFQIVGHSLGGRVALEALGLAPAVVARVTLLDIGPGPLESADGLTARTVERLVGAPAEVADRGLMRAFLSAGGLPPSIVEWLLTNLEAPPGGVLRWRFDRGALRDLWPRIGARDLWPVVARHPERLRCIRGSESSYVDAQTVARWGALGARPVETLEGAGHFLHVDRPAELLALLRDHH